MAKEKMQDLVVILPGVTGSVLQKDGKDLWGISGQAVGQLLKNHDALLSLKLEHDDLDRLEEAGDGIKATRVIASPHLIPRLAKVDGYYQLSRLITDYFDVILGDIYQGGKPANFFEFPYDWRRDNRVTAKLLKRLLDERLKQWRDYTGNQNAKVILLAHSMGGLVSRYYLEVLEGWRDCKALISFGTPYRGALGTVDSLANGYKQLFMDLTDALRSMSSLYQLLPIYPSIEINGTYHRIAEAPVELPNIVRSKAEDALRFHEEIEEAVKRHQEDAVYLKSYKTIPIVGTKQVTLQSASLVDGKIMMSSDLPRGMEPSIRVFDGDGTVPYFSAIPIELSEEYRETYIPEQHGSLQNNYKILTQLRDRLVGMQQTGLKSIRGPEPSPSAAKQPAISLSLDDLYLADEAVAIQAKVIDCEDPGGLKAQVALASGSGSAKTVEFQQQSQDGWSLVLDDLSSGLYRLTVQSGRSGTQTPEPVHALFEVMK